MLGYLILLFTIVPAVELYILFQVGDVIGGLNTILIIIGTGILGASLAKSQGFSILQKIQSEMQTGQIPASQITQGLMVFAGGLLLLTPGIITDILGFSLVLPGTRHMLLIFVQKLIEKMLQSGNLQFHSFSQQSNYQQGEQSFSHQKNEDVIEAEFTEKK